MGKLVVRVEWLLNYFGNKLGSFSKWSFVIRNWYKGIKFFDVGIR